MRVPRPAARRTVSRDAVPERDRPHRPAVAPDDGVPSRSSGVARIVRAPTRPSGVAPIALTATLLLAGAGVPSADATPSTLRRCGTIAVPNTEARAAVSLRGRALPCTTVRRVTGAAYRRSVLIGDTRPFTLSDAGRSWRCRYTPSSGGMVCEATGRRLRGTI